MVDVVASLNLEDITFRSFTVFDKTVNKEHTFSIKAMKTIPMFLTISKNKVTRYFSSDPPRLQQIYKGEGFTDADAGFYIKKLLIGLENGGLELRNLIDGKNIKMLPGVHTRVMGVVYLQHMEFFAPSGDKLVKIFD